MNTLPIVVAIIGASASLGAIFADVSTECGAVNRSTQGVARLGLLAAAMGLAVMITG
jgi:hypothetical protein